VSEREILFVAGEASADLHAAPVAAALSSLLPDVKLAGVGGDRMAAEGVSLIEHAGNLAVMGFAEVIRHVPKHWLLLRSITARMSSGRVRLVVLLDYPGFNMKVARAAREEGIPVLYYITPQVWAWGAGRLEELARTVTRAAVILPFEEKLLREHGIDATFVGHPLLDRATSLPSRDEARQRLGLAPDARVLALFPGSRRQEIARHLESFVATARELRGMIPGLEVRVAVAPTVDIVNEDCPFPLVRDDSFTMLRAADAAMCKSGTTTLEAAVAGCPLVVAYRTSSITYGLARRFVKIPHIGLVNVVAGKEVAPEFVQDALVPAAIAKVLEQLIMQPSRRDSVKRDLDSVRQALGTPGAAARVAAIAAGMLQ
jgi:lipid-A-disaccharide synthase